jgi:hypothetical protein
MKKIAQILFGIVALLAFVAATPPIRYSIYTTGTVAQVDAHVSSVSTNLAMNGVSSFNTRVGAVALLSNDVVTALGFTPGTGSGTGDGITNNQSGVMLADRLSVTGATPGLVFQHPGYDPDGLDGIWFGESIHGIGLQLGKLGESLPNVTVADGDVFAGGFYALGDHGINGNGENITNLNASALASGTVPLERLSGISSNEISAATWLAATNTTPGWRLTEPGHVGGTNTFEPVYTVTQGTNLFIRGNTNSAADGLYTVQTNWTDGEATAYLYTNANADVIWSREVDLDRIYTFTNAAGQANFTEGVILPTFQSRVTNTLSGGLCGTAAFGWTTNYTFGGFGVNGSTASDGAVLAFGQGLDYTTNGAVWTIYATNITEECLSSNVWFWATNVGGQALTPWSTNINGGGFSLSNVASVQGGIFYGDGDGLTNVSGGNVIGQVSHADLANMAISLVSSNDNLGVLWSPDTNSVVVGAYAVLYGNGAGLTNLDGSNIQAGTVSSNSFDAETAAQLALAGTGSDTNFIQESARFNAWSTNYMKFGSLGSNSWSGAGTNVLGLWLTNGFAGAEETSLGGLYRVIWTADYTNWSSVMTNIPVAIGVSRELACMGCTGNDPDGLTNLVIWSWTNPDVFGKTNSVLSQLLQVDSPRTDSSVTPKSWVLNNIARMSHDTNKNWSATRAVSRVDVEDFGLSLDSQFEIVVDKSQSNYFSVNMTDIGERFWQARSTNAPARITEIQAGGWAGTNPVTIYIETNGLAAAPTVEYASSFQDPQWRLVPNATNSYPETATNDCYMVQFDSPVSPAAFRASVKGGKAFQVFGDVQAERYSATPYTVTNAADTTWGYGAGLIRWDADYIYVSTASNTWKRAALTSWP